MVFLNPLAIHFNHESIANVVIMIWPVRIKDQPCGVESLEKILELTGFGTSISMEEGFWSFGFSMDLVEFVKIETLSRFRGLDWG